MRGAGPDDSSQDDCGGGVIDLRELQKRVRDHAPYKEFLIKAHRAYFAYEFAVPLIQQTSIPESIRKEHLPFPDLCDWLTRFSHSFGHVRIGADTSCRVFFTSLCEAVMFKLVFSQCIMWQSNRRIMKPVPDDFHAWAEYEAIRAATKITLTPWDALFEADKQTIRECLKPIPVAHLTPRKVSMSEFDGF